MANKRDVETGFLYEKLGINASELDVLKKTITGFKGLGERECLENVDLLTRKLAEVELKTSEDLVPTLISETAPDRFRAMNILYRMVEDNVKVEARKIFANEIVDENLRRVSVNADGTLNRSSLKKVCREGQVVQIVDYPRIANVGAAVLVEIIPDRISSQEISVEDTLRIRSDGLRDLVIQPSK